MGDNKITSEDTQRLVEFYDRECTYMDYFIGEFVRSNPDVIFFITSDHGDMFGENYTYSHSPGAHGVTPQLSHLPFIISGPGVKKKDISDYNCSLNVGTTILDLYNVNEKNGYGRSFLQEILL